jgi:hypothetical protein
MSKIGYCVMDTKTNTCYVEIKEFKSEEEFKKFEQRTTLSLEPINGVDSVWRTKPEAEKRCTSRNAYYEDWDKYLDECIQ